ncbi:MAG: acetate--CoA ligase family protein, partial [Leucothrix sp.]
RRAEILEAAQPLTLVQRSHATASQSTYLNEYDGKLILQAGGIAIPAGRLVTAENAEIAADEIGYPLVLKMVSAKLAHKTEAGAVKLNLQSAQAVSAAIASMQQAVLEYDPAAVTDQFLLEPMVPGVITELMVSIRHDEQFGLAMTLASGGIFIELIADAVTLLLPTSEQEILTALGKLKVAKLLDGFRGKPAVDKQMLVAELIKLAEFMATKVDEIAEVEINPLFVCEDGVCAIDVLLNR